MRETTHIRGGNYARYLQPKPLPWWRRHATWIGPVALLAAAILLARLGGN